MSGTRRGNRESWMPDEPNARGYYQALVWMGSKPDGRPDRRHIERKSKAARNKAVRELERKRDAGLVTKAGRVKTIEEMVTRHLDVVLPQRGRAPKTIISYRSLCEHQVFQRWGAQRIDRMLPEWIEDGYAEMQAAGLSASTIVKVHAILSSAYEIEVRRGNVARNPFRLVEAPRLPQPGRRALSIVQARAVLGAVENRRNAARSAVGLACGLRQGEALGGYEWEAEAVAQLVPTAMPPNSDIFFSPAASGHVRVIPSGTKYGFKFPYPTEGHEHAEFKVRFEDDTDLLWEIDNDLHLTRLDSRDW